MALILAIESATTVCSVALLKDGGVTAIRESNTGFTHAENMTAFIREVCAEASVTLQDLDAIAVSSGPGSYTGLRIGASTAKGLCYALHKPLITVSTLKSLAAEFLFLHAPLEGSVLVPMIDARRMEVYCCVFDLQLNEVTPAEAIVVGRKSFSQLLEDGRVFFFGDGSAKCKALLHHEHASFAEVSLSASGMRLLAEEKFRNQRFSDVSLFEPYYLKEAAIGSKTPKGF